ncbi:MAG: hypothetical protein FWH41_00775 [Treponema sp.]|nr:hypothetical protein [Treponema sp.]
MKRRISLFIFIAITVSGSIFAETVQDELWKNKILYLSGSFGLGPIMGPDVTALGGSLNPVQIDWQVTRWLSVGTGINFYFGPQAKYTAPKQTDPNSGIMETYSGVETHILFPLLLKYTLRPKIFSIEIGGGVYAAPVVMSTMVERTNDNGYTTSEAYGKKLFSAKGNNPFGFIVSGGFGVKAGQGIIFMDLRYLRDFSEVTIKFKDEKIGSHLWNMIAVNVGYKIGFFK